MPQTRTVTYEEWLTMPEVQDATEEVVNGEIRVMPPAKLIHALIIDSLYYAIVTQIDRSKVRVLASSAGLVVRKHPLTSRVPDIAIFDLSTMVEADGYVHSAPQLIVEVLSPANTRRDRAGELADYAALGVPEVWVVSPEARTVEVLRLSGTDYARAAIVASGDTLRPTLFPSVQVEISGIWPD